MSQPATPDDAHPDPQQLRDALLGLRQRAEKRRSLVTQATEHQTPEQVQRLVLELQTHQIELEMQYEELLLAQTEQQHLQQQYADLYDFAPVGYLSLNADAVVQQLNLCAAQLLGGVRQGLLGRRFLLWVAPTHRSHFVQFLTQVLDGSSGTSSCELELLRQDGSPFFAQLYGTTRPGGQGQPHCQLAIVDTAARRRATDALAASEARFRATFEQSNDGMILIDDHRFVDANDAAVRLLGLPGKAALLGRHLTDFWPERQPDGRSSLGLLNDSMNTALLAGWCRLEWARYNAAGELVWDEMSFNPVEIQGQVQLHCVWRDITAQRTAREQLRESEERLQLALASASFGVWSMDFATEQVHCDARTWEIFGRPGPPRPLDAAELMALVHPDDVACLQRAIAERVPFDAQHRIVHPDGTVLHVAGSGKVVYDAQGEPLRLSGLLRDITHKQQAEEQLQREKRFSESLLEHSIDAVLALDLSLRVTAWNAEATRYFGLSAGQVMGQPIAGLYPLITQPTGYQHLRRVLAGEQVALLGLRLVRSQRTYDAYLVPLRDPAGQVTGILIIVRDVSERERLAEEATQLRLRQQQEVLTAVLDAQEAERKRIAEGLHNGVGQLLSATKLSLGRLNLGTEQAPALREGLRLLDEAIRTTRSISYELTPGILEDFGLPAALRDLVKRVPEGQLPVHLHLSGLGGPRLPAPVEMAVYRITQELLGNVLRHAGATEVTIHVVQQPTPRSLLVSVEDNGRGFEVESVRPGSGLGLRSIRNRAKLLGGTFKLESRPGQGTIATVEVPVA